MRKVEVDPAQKTITAQGAAEHGLATVGGTVNHTGIGGLTLGGGYGWLTGAYGLTIDNLLEAELVLADGSIVTASHTENEDLFWAVRGAGTCFGVATKFAYRAHEQKNQIWAGLFFFPPPMLEKVFEFANQQVEVTGGKHAMAVAFGAPPPAHQPLILVIVMYNGPESEGREFFAPLIKLGPLMDTTTMMPYASLNGIMNAMVPHGDRKTQKGSAYLCPLEPSFAQSVLDDYATFIKNNSDAGRTVIIFEYLSPHQWMKVGPTDTAFANRGNYCNVLIVPTWSNKENDMVIRQWSRDMAAKFQTELVRKKSENGVDKSTMEAVAEYTNYDGMPLFILQVDCVNIL
jgi:FAD binding domain